MLTVGKILKKARERKALTYKEASEATFIKPEYLEKLEHDDFSGFKSTTFVKGFIRTYADFLGLDVEKVMAIYRRQVGEEEQPLKVYKNKEVAKALVISPIHVLAAFLVLFFVGVIAYMLKLYIQAGQPPKLEIIEPKEEYVKTTQDKITIKGVVEPNTVVKINGQPVHLDEKNAFSLTFHLQKGDNIIEVQAYKLHLEDRKTVKKIVVNYTDKQARQEVKPTNEPQKLEKQDFKVETTGNAWLQIIADDIQVDVGIKPKGYSKTFKAKSKVIVKSGRPNNTILYMAGKKQDLPPAEALGDGWTCEKLASGEWACR